MSAERRSGIAFRLAAAALAGAPLGFAGGALLGGHTLTDPTAPEAGATILACAFFGALFVAGAMMLATTLLTPKAARIATLIGGAASVSVVVYVVQDFIGDRMAQARAFDAAYERMPLFELTLEAANPNRSPFSKLQYESGQRQYAAHRPGGWLCRGTGNRQQTVALFEGLGNLQDSQESTDTAADNCQLSASWRVGDVAIERCLDSDGQALIAAAETMVEATERRSSCQRIDE